MPPRRIDVPAIELEVVLDRVVAEPVDVLVVLDARFPHRAPDLDDPAEHAEVIVDPVEHAPITCFGW
jgi:hypothetical protein